MPRSPFGFKVTLTLCDGAEPTGSGAVFSFPIEHWAGQPLRQLAYFSQLHALIRERRAPNLQPARELRGVWAAAVAGGAVAPPLADQVADAGPTAGGGAPGDGLSFERPAVGRGSAGGSASQVRLQVNLREWSVLSDQAVTPGGPPRRS